MIARTRRRGYEPTRPQATATAHAVVIRILTRYGLARHVAR